MRSIRFVLPTGLIVLSAVVVLQAQSRSRGRPQPPDRAPATPDASAASDAPVAPAAPARPSRPSRVMPTGDDSSPAQPTRLRVEFFQLVCPMDRLSQIPIDELEGEDMTAGQIVERLSELGDARLVVRMMNVLDLFGSSILTEGTRLPTVQDVRVSKEGQVTPSVTYEEVGAIVEVQGAWMQQAGRPIARLRCEIQLSSIGRTGVSVASGVNLPSFQQFKVEQHLALENGRPILLLSNTQVSPSDQEHRCTATVLRLTAWRLGAGPEAAP